MAFPYIIKIKEGLFSAQALSDTLYVGFEMAGEPYEPILPRYLPLDPLFPSPRDQREWCQDNHVAFTSWKAVVPLMEGHSVDIHNQAGHRVSVNLGTIKGALVRLYKSHKQSFINIQDGLPSLDDAKNFFFELAE